MIFRTGFRLSKWYLDCVDENGSLVIIYIAKLRWEMFSVSYSEILEYHASAGLRSRASFGACQQPNLSDNMLNWSSPSLGIDATWRRQADPVSQTLLSSPDAEIVWDCHFPAARGSVQFAQGHHINGFGYVEQLSMSIKPWHLPINELRWGRYYDGVDAIVWIDWQGPTTASWLFYNGKPAKSAVIDDNSVALADGGPTITFQDKQVIREGTPLTGILSQYPLLRTLLPKRMYDTYECKWLSRGQMTYQDTIQRQGWAIHEVVKWR